MSTRRTLGPLAFVATLLAGCGGGAATPSAAAPAGGGAASSTQSGIRSTATIFIPAQHLASAQREPSWVSPATKSITFLAKRSDGYAEYTVSALTPSTAGCATTNAGTTCIVPFVAPATTGTQTDEITVYLYDAADPNKGYPVALTDSMGNTVTSGAPNAFSFVLGGIVGKMPQLGPLTGYPVSAGTASDLTVPILVSDADGNPIAGKLDSPLKLTLSDTQTYAFKTPAPASDGSVSIADTGQVSQIVLHYNGAAPAGHSTTLTVQTTSADSASINVSYAPAPFVLTKNLTP